MTPLRNTPYLTLLLASMAIAIHASPDVAELFRYDRAAFLIGDWWRPATSWLSHFTTSHLFWNLLPLTVAGVLIESKQRRSILALALLTTLLHYALILDHEIMRYCGSSGLTVAMIGLLICERLSATTCRWLWGSLLTLIVLKGGLELFSPQPFFAVGNFRPLPAAHLIGLVSALLVFGALHKKRAPR